MLLLAQGEKELVQRPTSLAPWLELNHAMRTNMLAYEPPEEWRKQGPAAGRRVFKTHAVAALAPWRGGATEEGIPRGAGVIVVTRNPKDAAVSYFHHGRDTVQYKYTGDWAHFLHAIFLPGLVDFGDFCGAGTAPGGARGRSCLPTGCCGSATKRCRPTCPPSSAASPPLSASPPRRRW